MVGFPLVVLFIETLYDISDCTILSAILVQSVEFVIFLASDKRAGHITGQTVSVNGGYSMV